VSSLAKTAAKIGEVALITETLATEVSESAKM